MVGKGRLQIVIAEPEAEILLLAALISLLLHGKVIQGELLSVADDQKILGRILSQKLRDITGRINPVPVNLQNLISREESLLRLIRASLHEGGDHRHGIARRPGVNNEDDDEPEQKVHGRPCHKHQQALPHFLVHKCTGIFRLAVFPCHSAVAAEGNAADGVECLPLLLFENCRAHADGELLHTDAAGFCHCKVAELMDADQNTEKQDGNDNVNNHAKYAFTNSLAFRSASRISSRSSVCRAGIASTAAAATS